MAQNHTARVDVPLARQMFIGNDDAEQSEVSALQKPDGGDSARGGGPFLSAHEPTHLIRQMSCMSVLLQRWRGGHLRTNLQ